VSIFSKICPRCAGENPVSGSRCQCGFVFDGSATTGSIEALDIALQETEVYAEYLQVRMLQAKEIAEVAIAEQARSPDDAAKSSAAAEANTEFKAAKKEYDEQMALVAQLRRESLVSRDAETHKAQAAAWAKAAQLASAKKLEQKNVAVAPKKTPASSAKPAATKVTKTAGSTPAPTRPVAAIKPATNQSAPSPAMRQKMADAANCAAQRSRAQQAAQKPVAVQPKNTASAPMAAKKAPPRPAVTTQPKTLPRLNANEKECPNCTAVVPAKTQECKCGFGFAQGAEKMDGVGLSEEDRALLQQFQPANGN
jgi:hypothetical protein